jgi:catalase
LGVQIVDENDQLAFGFDVLDPTKIIPEELVPVTPLGKLQLNRNPRNFFAETEQVMVCRPELIFRAMANRTSTVPTWTHCSRR